MKVEAKWAVKVNGVWRKPGEVFEVESIADLPEACEVVLEEHTAEPEPEPEAEPKPRTAARTRKRTTK